MKGTIVNTVAVLVGSGVGLLLKRGIPVRYQQTVMQGLALAVLLIGLQMAFKTHNIVVVILSMVLGGIVGEAIDIDERLNRLGDFVTARLGSEYGNAGQGFITASLVFCVGAMAIVGSLQDGLTGDATTLYAKSTLDAISSIVFASSLGIGVALSSIVILVYQGGLTLLAGSLSAVLSESVIVEMTAVGGVLIVGIALMMLEIKKIKVANLLPAIPVAAILTLLWPA
ncbi:protein of unknown function DUF554 [Thermosinus carboxydivorans Nor1]|uniref:Transport protein n=1 Tax=Thermosinus carboxydivorans Nor1 TaxID=401526 RepID=A1HSN1_9FIRM|nr:DUF554 domain-containing protein [Thermosinus carboxydivorans]EAX47000.1 protein of unknown function DUF554 [Thermosinus carboxydivorans Nor1]